MAKGGRSRHTKRPTPAVKRAPVASPPPRPANSADVTTTNQPATPTTPPRPVMTPPAPAAKAPAAASSHAATPPALSPAERWISAFTRGFPYVLAEYCLFLLAVYAGPAVALTVGALLVILIIVNRATHGLVVNRLPANVVQAAEGLLGRRDDVLASFGVVGAGLLLWALWNLAGVMLFSWLAIIALLAALFLLFYAQRLQTPREM